LLLLFILSFGFLLQTPSAAVEARSLDQGRIHHFYDEGDFDRVIALIDSFTLTNKTYSLTDSIFIAKHLSVVYTANPATREKGKGYMFRLLDLMPSAKIVDMFVSDEIDRIFEKIKEEYVVHNKVQAQKSPMVQKKASRVGPVYLIAGGVALIVVAGSTYMYLNAEPPKDKVYGLPNE
jgi:hypothetical protein